MNCQKCGANLEEGVLFCRECGAKVEAPKKRFCRECGAVLAEGDKFCTECGAKADIFVDTPKDPPQKANISDDTATSKPNNLEKKKDTSSSYAGNSRKTEKTVTSEEKTTTIVKSPKPPKKQSKKTLLIVVAVILLLAVIGSLGGKSSSSRETGGRSTESSTSSGSKIAVINVIDMTYPEAADALLSAGFTNITTNVDSNTDESQWVVIKQSVNAGKSIRPGDKIELTCVLKCKLYIDIHSEANLMFSTYDIAVSLDGTEIGSIPNGKGFTYLADVLSGDHSLVFCKAGSSSPKCTKKIAVSGDMTYSCDLGHSGSSINIKNEKTDSSINGATLEVIDVTGMVLSEAMAKLSEIGFSNVREEPYSSIWDKDNWIVTAQGIAAGTVTDKNEFIQLDCISLDDYFSNTYVGKSVSEIQELAAASGFYLRFENDSWDDIIDEIATMDQETKNDWVATKARQYGGADKTAVVTIKYTGVIAATPEPISTPKPEGSSMPILPGTSLDSVLEAAKAYGLSRAFSDENFGHGTKMCSLTSSNGGLTMDVIYSGSTKEVLCGSIVTFNTLSSADEQKAFIKAMADVLCPSDNKTEVTNWVNSNVGGSAETTIGGFVYEVGLGPSGNCLYYAGERNWEEWDLSFG